MRPKVFIGSSTEGLPVAEALQIELQSECDPILWNQGFFEPGRAFLEDLSRKATGFDFAVLVLTPDDRREREGKTYTVARDNVIFEAGLFVGVLGRERTLVVRPDDVPSFGLFSDYDGISAILYSHRRFQEEQRPALGAAANRIKEQIRKQGPNVLIILRKLGLSFDDIGDFYRRTGLTHAYGARHESIPRMLSDIRTARRSVKMYARVYISNLLKDEEELARALAEAARGDARDGGGPLTVVHVSTHSDDDELAERYWRLEDPKARSWATLNRYREHLAKSDGLFRNLFENLATKLSADEAPHAHVRLVRRYVTGCELPYSAVTIDDRILYVSFYSLSTARTGSFAPTLRLFRGDDGERSWGDVLLSSLRDIDDQYLDREREEVYETEGANA